ncbi:hypothetical protein [Streptomyces sp. DSM 40750]|uniref:hypothetical protein n=1 Tax=Streptomyces sp. DSM 40750 TaxID=2801030 RepID=UPI00214AB689|nr:hypothetical protein [Streptomyces sp. DSM 40750]UUU24587.1 hypothetical protein JIX55_32440 [Streptomyces sp. DSM 40750]
MPSATSVKAATAVSPGAFGSSAEHLDEAGFSPGHPAPRPRGRHRRPRPRKVLFAVGGMALAAGALSLLRLASDPVGGGSGAAGAAPRAADEVTDEATNAGATMGSEPSAGPGTPTADTPMGGGNPAPTGPPSPGATAPTPTPSTFLPASSIGVQIPSGPGARNLPGNPAAADTTPTSRIPETPRPTPPAPTRPPAAAPEQPTTPDSATAPGDTATPAKPTRPGLCVLITELCVNDALGR